MVVWVVVVRVGCSPLPFPPLAERGEQPRGSRPGSPVPAPRDGRGSCCCFVIRLPWVAPPPPPPPFPFPSAALPVFLCLSVCVFENGGGRCRLPAPMCLMFAAPVHHVPLPPALRGDGGAPRPPTRSPPRRQRRPGAFHALLLLLLPLIHLEYLVYFWCGCSGRSTPRDLKNPSGLPVRRVLLFFFFIS